MSKHKRQPYKPMSEYTAEVTQWVMWEDTIYDGVYIGYLRSDGLTFQFKKDDYGMYSAEDADNPPQRLRLFTLDRKLVAWTRLKDAPAIRAAVNKSINEAHTLCREIRDANGDPTRYRIDIEPDKVLFRASRQLNEEPTVYQRRQDGSVEVEAANEQL